MFWGLLVNQKDNNILDDLGGVSDIVVPLETLVLSCHGGIPSLTDEPQNNFKQHVFEEKFEHIFLTRYTLLFLKPNKRNTYPESRKTFSSVHCASLTNNLLS